MNTKELVLERMNNGFFKDLPVKRRRFLESRLEKMEYSPGAQIIKQGRSGHFLGIVESGQVILENSHEGPQTLTTGDYFGTEMLHFGKPSPFTVTAETDAIIWVLRRSDWLAPSLSVATSNRNLGFPLIKKGGWIAMGLTTTILMVAIILGPLLLENVNKSLPYLMAESGYPRLAEDYLELLTRVQPESAKAFGTLGDFLVSQEKDQEAIEAYQQAIDLDEYLPWIHNNVGVLLLDQNEIDLAIYHFRMAINLNPDNIHANRNLGNAYYTLEQWEAAARAYQQALDLDSTLLDTKADLAGLILYESQLEEARKAWEEVLLEQPRHPLALQGLGVISLLEDDPFLALLYLDAARYIDPDDLTTRLYIGLALEGLDRSAEAAEEYEFVVESGSDLELIGLADSLLQVLQD
jgi:tetratricopeptide (TPR) repeat protein